MSLPIGDRVAFVYPDQAAAAAGVPITTIVAAVKAGKLITRQAGASKVILRGDLEKFVATLPTARKDPPKPTEAEKKAAYERGRARALRAMGQR
jgi:hypothetical protein